jgi:hypothetical protein
MCGDHGVRSSLIGHRDLRLCQVTQTQQTINVVQQGADIFPESIKVLGTTRRRFGHCHSVVNAPKCINQRPFPAYFLEACKGFQELLLVPLHGPLPWLRKKVNPNANHNEVNRSDSKALTHVGSVRERDAKTSLLRRGDVGLADRILPKTHVLRRAYDRHRALVRQFDHARQKRPCISFPSSSLIGALRQNCILEGTDICQWKLVFPYVTRRDESCPMTFNFGPQLFAMIQHLRWSNPRPSGFPVRGLPNAVDQSLPVYPFKGREVLSLVPLDCPFPGLGKEANRNANHHSSNCSDQQALTHLGSVRERDAKTSLSLRRRTVDSADCGLNFRQVRRRGNNMDDLRPLSADSNKASPCLIPKIPGRNGILRECICQRDPRFLQVTEADQRRLVLLKGFDVGTISVRVPRIAQQPCGNPKSNTFQLVLPRIHREPVSGFQVFLLVPLDGPLLGLGKEVDRNANNRCSNCSDQQPLTHIGSVRERDAKTSLSLTLTLSPRERERSSAARRPYRTSVRTY